MRKVGLLQAGIVSPYSAQCRLLCERILSAQSIGSVDSALVQSKKKSVVTDKVTFHIHIEISHFGSSRLGSIDGRGTLRWQSQQQWHGTP